MKPRMLVCRQGTARQFAGLLLLALLTGGPPAGAVESYRFDFRVELDPQMFRLYGGSSPEDFCTTSAEGLRIVLPEQANGVGTAGVASRFVLRGDFVLTARYNMLDCPVPKGGYGAGLTMVVIDVTGQYGSLQSVMQKDRGHRLVAHRAVRETSGKYTHLASDHPAPGQTGRIRLTRSGSVLLYSVAADDAPGFKTLHETEFTIHDISEVQLAAQTGEWPCPVEGAWVDLEVQADRLIPPVSPVPIPGPLRWTFLLLVVLVAAQLAAMWAGRRSRRARSARAQEQEDPTVDPQAGP